jgi:hypothetical protein
MHFVSVTYSGSGRRHEVHSLATLARLVATVGKTHDCTGWEESSHGVKIVHRVCRSACGGAIPGQR